MAAPKGSPFPASASLSPSDSGSNGQTLGVGRTDAELLRRQQRERHGPERGADEYRNLHGPGVVSRKWRLSEHQQFGQIRYRAAKVTVQAVNDATTYDGSAPSYPLTSNYVTASGASSGTDQTPAGTYTCTYYCTVTPYSAASPYNSATAPTSAGTYTVTVAFVATDEDGRPCRGGR